MTKSKNKITKGFSLEKRLRHYSKEDPNTGCWLWKACTVGFGYGQVSWGRKMYPAHRMAYETFVGPIPEGMLVLHSCNTPACINPAHLRVGTQQENMDDMSRSGNSLRGERHPSAKLNEKAVKKILSLRARGKTLLSIAQEYGVSQSLVWAITKHKTWKHLREKAAA